jgi:hypothetical protein
MRTPNGFTIIKGETISNLASYNDFKNATSEIAKKLGANATVAACIDSKSIIGGIAKKIGLVALYNKGKEIINGVMHFISGKKILNGAARYVKHRGFFRRACKKNCNHRLVC